ncbi:C2 calcium-dependent domain-containing protein 4C-like [Nothobranchius furzeri]|uniref:Transcript variant X1 n=1 Tax=Nothobranchius furzeri TaxID=105023 RepID=A0A9D3BJR5_NOTFU|nr:transcript variant X1 [Nothobranchius furzeri]KAF7210822.1 transcript variant X2 [Nothobranchius furzeri]
MSAVKSGVSLRTLVLTPERIPSFLIPSSRSPFVTPRLRRTSTDRTRLLSDNDDQDSSGTSQPGSPTDPVISPRFALRLPTPRTGRLRRTTGTDEASVDADADRATRAAMSLCHVPKVTTSYGFRAVLSASPCTRRRESLFHRSEPVTVKINDVESPEPEGALSLPLPHPPSPCDPGRSRVSMRPVKALGLQMMMELKKPAAALRAMTPSRNASHRK